MTELTIKFNYVQDCVVLLREDLPLIKKIPEIAHNSGTTIEREPEFDITIVVK